MSRPGYGEKMGAARRLFERARARVRVGDVATAADVSHRAAEVMVARMVARGEVRRVERGVYARGEAMPSIYA